MSPLAAIVWGNSYDYTVLGNSLYLVKGFTKCLKIVKLFSITGLCLWWIWHSRVIMASWFRSKYFLQSWGFSNVEGKFSFQIGHREVFSLWGKNPIDYRESHFYIQPHWKSWENFDHGRAPHWIRPCAELFTFLTDRRKGCALQLWSAWFSPRHALHVIIRSISKKTKHCVSECVSVCCYNFCSKETMTKVVPFKLALVCFANDYIGLVVF